jgi:hypothetical protein
MLYLALLVLQRQLSHFMAVSLLIASFKRVKFSVPHFIFSCVANVKLGVESSVDARGREGGRDPLPNQWEEGEQC